MDNEREPRHDGEIPQSIKDKMKALYDEGLSIEKIAFEIGCVSATYVRNRVKKYGWTRDQTRKYFTQWSDDKDRTLMSMRSEGKSWAQIGSAVGKTHQACERRYQSIKNSPHIMEPIKHTEWQKVMSIATSRPWR